MSVVDEAPARPRDCAGFARFWTASTVSGFGTYVTTIAIQVMIVLTLHEGAAAVGLVNAARWLPYLLFGLVAGVLVDRARRRPVLVVTDLGRGVLLVAIPMLALTHRLSLPVLMGFMIAFGLMSLFNDAADQSFLPRIVPARLLTAANARLDQSGAVAQTCGPALAGGLVSLLTAPWAVLIDAVSYLVCGVLIAGVPVDEERTGSRSVRGIGREAADGLRWVYRHPTLRPLAFNTHFWFLCSAVAGAVVTPFALRTLGMSPFGLGLALAVGGLGGLAGSLAATRLGSAFGAGRVVVSCRALTAVAWAVIALAAGHLGGWVLFGLGQLLFGLALGAENANELGYWQAVTPDNLQGRTNATRRSINRSMIVIGAPAGGLLADTFGYRLMLWCVAAGFLAVAGTLAASRFRHARIGDVVTQPVATAPL